MTKIMKSQKMKQGPFSNSTQRPATHQNDNNLKVILNTAFMLSSLTFAIKTLQLKGQQCKQHPREIDFF